jgi:hypothetical protein
METHSGMVGKKVHTVVVAVKKRKGNCNVNEKEVIKIVAEYKRSKYTCSD